MSRFDYIRYDELAQHHQTALKELFLEIEKLVGFTLCDGRSKSLALTALEEAYTWIGKAIRDDQIARVGKSELQEECKNA